MNFSDLRQGIQTLSDSFRQNAVAAVNTHLTVRNWLIGYYIVEFEQNGEDRAKYGTELLQNLAKGFSGDGLSYRNLNLYRQFYNCYPQIEAYVPQFLKKYFPEILQSPIAELQIADNKEHGIGQSVIAQFNELNVEIKNTFPVEKLVQKLSYTHLTLLFPIDDPIKRLFYEVECIKGTWSVRELRRQIDSLYFERSGMSQNPALLSQTVQENSETDNMLNTIKSPFVFEFLGLKQKMLFMNRIWNKR